MKVKIKTKINSWLIMLMAGGGSMMVSGITEASYNIGNVASSITNTFTQITQLITAGSYLAGLGFSIGAIMKFKAHKDNPTQITIGTPVALTFIAAALLFLPSILGVAGYTMFTGGGKTSGPGGSIFSASGS